MRSLEPHVLERWMPSFITKHVNYVVVVATPVQPENKRPSVNQAGGSQAQAKPNSSTTNLLGERVSYQSAVDVDGRNKTDDEQDKVRATLTGSTGADDKDNDVQVLQEEV